MTDFKREIGNFFERHSLAENASLAEFLTLALGATSMAMSDQVETAVKMDPLLAAVVDAALELADLDDAYDHDAFTLQPLRTAVTAWRARYEEELVHWPLFREDKSEIILCPTERGTSINSIDEVSCGECRRLYDEIGTSQVNWEGVPSSLPEAGKTVLLMEHSNYDKKWAARCPSGWYINASGPSVDTILWAQWWRS